MSTDRLTNEQIFDNDEQNGGPCMERTKSTELVKKLREIKEQHELTLPRVMDMMEANGKIVSFSTLRRVFTESSDPNSFSYENTLTPIADVLLPLEEESERIVDSPHTKEIDALKSVIRCQNEEINRMQETKELLDSRVTFLISQIERKDRRMDEKDEIIRRLMDERDELTRKLLDKVL